ncbi:MAG: hypothetical protein RLZ12_421 [Bacillota bacterium]|jgi:tetratricopeptide (TPR) repeat protein
MPKLKKSFTKKNKKVVILTLDANFFADRAIQAWDRQEYYKATKYCRQAIALEKNNYIHHYNLASILAEMGCFEESNRTLEIILEELEPSMHDCLYYIANNYACLSNLLKSEEYLIKYLEADANGIFAEEAREMLDRISEGLGKNGNPKTQNRHPAGKEYSLACTLLENGNLSEAIKHLQPLALKYVNFLPAWNKLTLAYCYIDKFTAAEAAAKHVLTKDSKNIEALCNMTLIYHQQKKLGQVSSLVKTLSKVLPLDPTMIYKIATTLGTVGKHHLAYNLFKNIIDYYEPPSLYLYHYLALASVNLGQLTRAFNYWHKACKIDPDNDVINFFIYLIKTTGSTHLPLPYKFIMPFAELLLAPNDSALASKLAATLKHNGISSLSYIWAVKYGSPVAREAAKDLAYALPPAKLSEILKPFTRSRTSAKENAKRIALLLLMLAKQKEDSSKNKKTIIKLKK